MEPEDGLLEEPWWSRYKWWLVIGLALAIVLIILGVVFATQSHHRKHQPTPTPTPTVTPRPTPSPLPTPNPTHGAAPTPTTQPTQAPSPTPTPSLTPIPTVVGLSLGYVHRSPARIQQIQSNASAGQPGYKSYLSPVKSLQYNLQSYGFTGQWRVIQPPQPSATPTVSPRPYTAPDGTPAEKFIVSYQGHTYEVILEQLAQHGTGGVWLIWQVGPKLT